MNILAFSDLHRDAETARAIVKAASRADVVVGAGDFATAGKGALDTLKILNELPCPFVFVHGNHDIPQELEAFAETAPNMHYLHGSSVEILGRTFFGVGGETPVFNDAQWNAGQTEEAVRQLLSECPEGAILVTHAPPFEHCDLQKNGQHEGSVAILDAARRTKPTYVLCGHIHNAWGMRSCIGPTAVANLGPQAVTFDLNSSS